MRQGAFTGFWQRGLTEEVLCQNQTIPPVNGGEVEREESETHVLPGGLFGCGPIGHCANSPLPCTAPVKVFQPAAVAPALQISGTPDPVGIAEKHGLPQPPLILPDGSEMTWLNGDPPAIAPHQTTWKRENLSSSPPTTASPTPPATDCARIDAMFDKYLTSIASVAMGEITRPTGPTGVGGVQRTPPPTRAGGPAAVGQPAGRTPGPSTSSNNDPGGGGGGGGGSQNPVGVATPVAPGWTNIEIVIDPKILGAAASPYTKQSCKEPFMVRIKALFQKITARREKKFTWMPQEDEIAAENRIFLALVISHITYNQGPMSVEQNGLLDLFTYEAVQQQLNLDQLLEPPAAAAATGCITGLKVDFSSKYVLSGVSYDDPRQYFSVVDDGGTTPPELPDEVFLRPALVLATRMLHDMEVKKIKPTIRVDFPLPHTIKVNGTRVMFELLPVMSAATTLLDNVYKAQIIADSLADALEEINEARIDEIEKEYEAIVVDAAKVPPFPLRDRILVLAEAARTVNRLYNNYEMVLREVDHDGLEDGAQARVFSNPLQLIRFLRNSSEASCPWIRDSRRWISVNSCLVGVSSNGEHTATGGRLKIMQSPSRFLVERCLTHVDKTLERIYQLKRDIFARVPPPAPPVGKKEAKMNEEKKKEAKVNEEKVPNPFVTPIRPPPGLNLNMYAGFNVNKEKEEEDDLEGEGEEQQDCHNSSYPHALLQAGASLCQLLLDEAPGPHTPNYILTNYIDQLSEITREVRKVEWTGNVTLTPDHKIVRDNLVRYKTILQGYLADYNREQKSKEAQEREVARSLSFAKGPVLKDEGENIDQFLEYHQAFRSSCPLARALRMKNDLPKRLQTRVENISDPDEIEKLLKDTFLQSDVLIPQALKLVTAQKLSPRVNSKEEQDSYCSINSLVKRLEKQGLLGRLDFTMISACMARLSPQRNDDFELEWLKTKMRNKGMSTEEEERMKRGQFIEFIRLHEILLQKRTVQNSLNKKEDPKRERAFEIRETKVDKKKRIREGEKAKETYTCPLCKTPGGHPKKFGVRSGMSPKTFARCEVFKGTHPSKRMEVLAKHKACCRCLQTNHQVTDCKLDEASPWLSHEGCSEKHNPLACPAQKVERQCFTNTAGGSPCMWTDIASGEAALHENNAPGAPGALHDDVVVILAEQVVLRDQAGRAHSCVAVHDTMSDSSWVSSELAKTFPQKKKKKVTIPLQTVRGTSSFQTWEYQIGVKNEATNTFKTIRVFESPSVGSLHYNAKVHKLLQERFGTNIHFPRGEVQLLIGVRDHTFSPDSIRSHESLNLKLYKSALNPTRHLVCGSLPSALIEGLESGERSMFTQSELTKILLQDKGIDMVPQLCDFCKNKSLDCSECKLLNRPTSLRELTENELIKANLFFDKDKKTVCCKYVPSFSTWAEIFPPHLKNDVQARKVSRSLLRSLNKSNMLEQFQQVFHNFVKEGIFQELTKEDMEKWEDEEKGVNYINFHHVLKDHSQEERQKLRIVTNSSANRTGVVNGKLTECSLNACLPQGYAAFNQLEEIAISWMSAPTSLLLDVRKAYSNIRDCEADDQNKHLRRMVWFRDPTPGKNYDELEEVTYGIGPCHYGDRNAACLLANTMLKVAEDMSNDLGSIPASGAPSGPGSNPSSSASSATQTSQPTKDSISKFLKSMFVDDFVVNCKHPEEAFKLYEIYKQYLGNYSMLLHEPVISSAEGRHMIQGGAPLKEPPADEPETIKIIGFDFCPYTDSYKVPIQKRLKPSKKGKFKMKIGTDLTEESILAMERMSLRQIASFNASIFDLCGHLAPVKIFGKRLMARIVEANPPITKEAWDKDIPPDLLEEARQYLLLMTNLAEPEFQRGPPLPGGELTDLASFHDGSSCAFGTGIWGIWTRGEERRAKLLYAKARTARRTIVDQELSSLHQSVQISRVFLRIFPHLKRVFHLGDSEVSHKQLCTINCPKDTWTNNRIRDIVTTTKELTSQGVEVRFFHIKSEDNLSDRISKPVDDAQNFVHSSTWKFGFEWLKKKPQNWPVDNIMGLNTSTGLIEVSPSSPAAVGLELGPVQKEECAELGLGPVLEEERAMITQEGEDEIQGSLEEVSPEAPIVHPSGVQPSAPIFSDLLQRVSRIRIATRTIARIRNMAKEKSFLGLKKTLSEQEESASWYLLVRDQQKVMSEKRLNEDKLMVFTEDDIKFSRQRWDISTHLDLFNVDKLPLVDVDSRLGELLLADAHRPAAGPCRTRSHVKYHLRSSNVAALLTGPVEKRLTHIMSKCVPCRKRKIAIKSGDLTSFSTRMKADRFKVSHPTPFSKIACDTLGPVRVALDTGGVGTRKVARYAEHHVLVVACIAGSGACRYIQIPSTSADGFALGLHRLVAYTGYPPSVIFTDYGSGLVSAGKKEQQRVAKVGNDEDVESVIPKVLTDRYPNIQFECAKSSEQVKNGKAECLVRAWKIYVKDVLFLKPNAGVPDFTVLGLDLLCEEATRVVNCRPTAYLGSQDEIISPNSFLLAGFSNKIWGLEGELSTKYLQLQQYRERMFEVLERMMVNCDFTPSKWKKDERMPAVGDICFITRQKNKVSYILEYGQILEVQDNGRTLRMRVCRQGTSSVKEVVVSSRLVHLLFRPSL